MVFLPTAKPEASPETAPRGRSNRSGNSRGRSNTSSTPAAIKRLGDVGQELFNNRKAFYTGSDTKPEKKDGGWVIYGDVAKVYPLQKSGALMVAMTVESNDDLRRDAYLLLNSNFRCPNGETLEDIVEALESGAVQAIYCVGVMQVEVKRTVGNNEFVTTGRISDIIMSDGHIRVMGSQRMQGSQNQDAGDDIEAALDA